MIGQNDGVENEKQIVSVFNDQQIKRLTAYQQLFIKQLHKNAAGDEIIHAKKIGGQGYKPDVEIEISGETHRVSVKKGSGNSVHQEKTELFILYCVRELGMTDVERDSLLAFLFGDGTLDGDSLPEDRLKDQELIEEYSTEIEIVQEFLNRNKRSLLERFLIYGRKGQESGIKADYLYHGDANSGVWCPLDYDAIDYLVELPNSKEAPLSIGPLTVQVWNRNLEGKPEMEDRRHSIQVKWASCKAYIEAINERYLEKIKKEKEEASIRSRTIGNNRQGFENQENIVTLIDGKRVQELTSAVKSIVMGIFPYAAASEVVRAGKVTGSDVKPRVYIAMNGTVKYMTVFMGSGNSVHQEKISNFLDFCSSELGISDEEKKAFLTIMYGDGTINGDSIADDRLKGTEEVKKKYSAEVAIAQAFFDKNKQALIERFLIWGKGGKQKNIGTDFIYYGTDVTGRIASRETVIEYLMGKTGSDSALLSLGSLTTQPWNRNPEAKPNLEDRRHSLQIKWGGIKQDLTNICDAEAEKNIGTYDGDWEEYELVAKLNKDKKASSKLWATICARLDIHDLTDVYAVRVSNMVYSKISERQVLPKADVYLVKGKVPHELLLDNNFWIDEDSIKNYGVSVINGSGISCKRTNSSSFTYAKFTVKSFEAIFGDKVLGAGVSLFVSDKDKDFNTDVLRGWGVTEKELILKYSDYLLQQGIGNDEQHVQNIDACKIIKKIAIDEVCQRIRRDKNISDVVFNGKGVFEEPYTASFIYLGGNITTTYIPSFSVTTGSGRHKGNFTIVVKPSSKSSTSVLEEEVYSYDEAKQIVIDTFFGSREDISDLEILSEIVNQGYRKEGELVVKNKSASTEYFVELFEKEDVLNAEEYINRFGYAAIHTAIGVLEKAGKIIEFEKNQYISARKIMKLLSNSDALKQYCDIVYDNTQNIPFFTVKSIQEEGFGTEAEELGFEGLFYESLLKYDGRFSYSFIGERLVFSTRWKKFRLIDVLTEYVKKNNCIGVDNLIADFSTDFGIKLERTAILGQIKGTEMYHDTILDYIYKDYETYYQDV